MPFRSRNMVREAVAAFAVLAIYALVLLLPLHQAAGLQRDLASLGFETISVSSVCVAPAQQRDDGGNAPAAVKCAAAGIAKHEFAAIEPGAVVVDTVRIAETAQYEVPLRLELSAIHDHSGQARAPPVTV